jgi:hypothetical protein
MMEEAQAHTYYTPSASSLFLSLILVKIEGARTAMRGCPQHVPGHLPTFMGLL